MLLNNHKNNNDNDLGIVRSNLIGIYPCTRSSLPHLVILFLVLLFSGVICPLITNVMFLNLPADCIF